MKRCVGVALILAMAGLVSACRFPTQFKSVDQARGTVLVTGRLLTFGPTCAAKLSYLDFDFDRARDEEGDAIVYMASHGQPAEKIEGLRNRTAAGSLEMSSEISRYPEMFSAMCGRMWQSTDFDRYKKRGAVGTGGLPRSVSETELLAQDRDAAEALAEADAAQRMAESAEEDASKAVSAASARQ